MRDKDDFDISESGHGRKNNQKLKPYIVLQYLLKNTDENHTAAAADIIAYLAECGIYAERRSIYKDIEDINKVMYMLENGTDIYEAETAVKDDDEKTVLYDKSRKGFFVRQRHFVLNDIRLLAECVYAAKFIEEERAKKLVNVVCDFVSKPQARKIKHNAFLADRVKTTNKVVWHNISTINEAVSKSIDGQRHIPEKISFKYLRYNINNMQQTERRNGNKYIVSPYYLIINDVNYYLLAFDDKSKAMRTYRVDRMKNVCLTGEPRVGGEIFAAIDIKAYVRQHFSMYSGDTERVTVRFINPLLDTVVDRFGTRDVHYQKADEKHFTVNAKAAINDQFFAWVCGFGSRAKIISPAHTAEQFKAYLDKISNMYK